jgi:hypothetical protein
MARQRRSAMDALAQSDELIQRGSELRARSVRMCAVADEKMEKSRQLIAAAAKAQEVMVRAYGLDPAGRSGRVALAGLPADG